MGTSTSAAALLLTAAAAVAIATLFRHEKPAKTLYELLVYRARVANIEPFYGAGRGTPVPIVLGTVA
jgi:hypothetical protein